MVCLHRLSLERQTIFLYSCFLEILSLLVHYRKHGVYRVLELLLCASYRAHGKGGIRRVPHHGVAIENLFSLLIPPAASMFQIR